MPFQSKAQQRLMFSSKSPIGREKAKEWASKTQFNKLPQHVSDKDDPKDKMSHAVADKFTRLKNHTKKS